MTEQAQAKSIALFFFFCFLDEATAYHATAKTIKKLRGRLERSEVPPDKVATNLVYTMYSEWKKLRHWKSKGRPSVSYESGWLLPEGIDLGPWKQFQKNSENEEFLAVIWSRILGLSDEDISEGLGVTTGTVRHRVGRGLRVLGSMTRVD